VNVQEDFLGETTITQAQWEYTCPDTRDTVVGFRVCCLPPGH
jgi:hypothetical protein